MSLPSFPFQVPQIPTKGSGVNWKAVILWGIILGLIGFAIYYYREPLIAWATGIPASIGTWKLPSLEGFATGLMDYVNKNPIAVIAAGASICTAGVTLISKMRADNAKNAALNAQLEAEKYASQQVNMANQQALDYKNQYEQAIKSNSQDALLESQGMVSNLSAEKRDLQNQVKALQEALLNAQAQKVTVIEHK